MSSWRWLSTGREIFPAMLEAIAAAKTSIRLETYIYTHGRIGDQFRDALVAAQKRGVQVRVLVDALGSWWLAGNYFAPLLWAGGEARFFNPLRFWRLGVRDHRKLLICDDRTLLVGGFNIADEYDGDGVTTGWRDVGGCWENPELAKVLGRSFDEMFDLADFKRKPLRRLRGFKLRRRKPLADSELDGELLLSHPGRGASPFQRALREDLREARDVSLLVAYFLPPRRLRRQLMRVARRGGRVRLILPGRSDVLVSQLAAQDLYRRLMRAGVEIYEYQPQILHAKLMVIDGVVYMGSSNLDVRSLKLNYELLLRMKEPSVVAEAQEIFEDALRHSRRIDRKEWRKRTWAQRLESSWAHFLLARLDPFIALKQFKAVGQ